MDEPLPLEVQLNESRQLFGWAMQAAVVLTDAQGRSWVVRTLHYTQATHETDVAAAEELLMGGAEPPANPRQVTTLTPMKPLKDTWQSYIG